MNNYEAQIKKVKEERGVEFDIDPIFLLRRSSRAMDPNVPVTDRQFMTIVEAMRQAPSSSNKQPWSILFAKRETDNWPLFFDALYKGNQVWVKNGWIIGAFVSEKYDTGKLTTDTYSFDNGLATMSFLLESSRQGLVAHPMAGYDEEALRKNIDLPPTHQVDAMFVLGVPGEVELLEERFRALETSVSERKKIGDILTEGKFKGEAFSSAFES
ncbi:MAG: hypothetical protein S4CHLAM102_03270 [Chlamydiia bacterium]|nr:hypothetical protein [Chlamydiia bacterium]